MISAVTGFLNRHKRKFFVTAGVIASGYLAVDYLKSKFFELQDKLATERAAKENLRRRFEQNQQDATFTIMALLPSLFIDVLEKYPVEKITQELQAKRTEKTIARSTFSDTGVSDISSSFTAPSDMPTDPTQPQNVTDSTISFKDGEASTIEINYKPKMSKAQLWQELKIQSLTRLFTLVYSSALLVFFTRLQLNILGRKNYIASVIQLADHQQNSEITMQDASELPGLDHDNDPSAKQHESEEKDSHINRMYLTFSWWFLNKGWNFLSEQVNTAVVKVFDTINPRADLSLSELSELIGQVQYLIDYPEGQKPQNFLSTLLPPAELESYVLSQAAYEDEFAEEALRGELRRLLDETADFVESPNAAEVIKRLVHTGLTVIVNKIAIMYPQSDPSAGLVTSSAGGAGSPSGEEMLFMPRVKLASILANITRQATALGKGGSPLEPNEYISAMVSVPELDAFSAIVYSNFDWRSLDKDE
ncbi:hypothetical protein D0Z00_003969 [Geotrichum galactomycetum]|uniref:Uncharacterized protein n=1 Tax=Geotrichum galactomycetum TaxID=27317 RepID=A0ACB6V015_9ASCO|nr:hypothetical protein D0Z00_003969 [Geotrichum candidum]